MDSFKTVLLYFGFCLLCFGIISLLVNNNTMKDPIAQQIEACQAACSYSGLESYDAVKFLCTCKK